MTVKMRYQKTSKFLYHVMSKYNLKRKQLSGMMGSNLSNIYTYLNGYARPKREDVARLAYHLKEEPETFFALCYGPNDKDEAGKADFPFTRDEIIKNCDSRAIRSNISLKDGIHNFEYFLGGYLYLLMEGKKNLDSKSSVEVLDLSFCKDCLKEFEKNPIQRESMFDIPGKWFGNQNVEVFFENLPFDAPSIHFFNNPDEAVRFTKEKELNLSDIDKEILIGLNQLDNHQKSSILQTVREKIAYTTIKKLKLDTF